MRITDEMVQVFKRTPAPPGWVGDAVIRHRLKAVLDLIERDESERPCGRRQDGTLLCRPWRECPDCPLMVLNG
jgi:hypothetical protein